MEPIKDFEKIHLNTENCIVPKERILCSPSEKQGMSQELEVDLRITACEYIQAAGLLLQLPQVAMATAQVLFQRFYYAKSFIEFKARPMAMACLFVAAKIEEDCRKIRDVVNVFHHLSQKWTGRPIAPMDYMGEEYFTLKPLVIKYERRLLKELGFCVHVKHPHKLIIMYLQILEMETNAALCQKAWNYMNDGLRTNVFVRYSVETVACACIFLAARQLKIVLPQKPAWYSLFDVQRGDLEDISKEIMALYSHPRKNLEELERDVAVLKIQLASTKHVEVKEVNLKKTEEASSVAPSPSSQSDPTKEEERTASQQSDVKSTAEASGSAPSQSDVSSALPPSSSQDSSLTALPSSQLSTSSPVRNGDQRGAKRSLSLSPTRNKRTIHSASSSPKRRTSQSDRSRSRSPQPKQRRSSASPKPIISPIKFFSSSDSHSEKSNSLSPSPPPVSVSSRENGLPRQYRQDYHEHKSRHKHRSHKRERGERREREADKERRKHRHRRERDREFIHEREKFHYNSSRRDRDKDFERDRDYYRKSDQSRYR